MKKIFVLLLFLSANCIVQAQSFSTGVRGGAGYWCNHALKAIEGRHMSFVPEIFVRYNAKHKWAFEAAFNTSMLSGYRVGGEVYDAPWRYEEEVTDIRNIEGKFSVQYDLTCPAMKHCPLLERMHSYVGISLNPLLANVTQTFYADHSSTPFMVWKNRTLQFWTGINHTMTFDLSKHFALISVAEVQVQPTELFACFSPAGSYNPAAKFGLQFGGSYRF